MAPSNNLQGYHIQWEPLGPLWMQDGVFHCLYGVDGGHLGDAQPGDQSKRVTSFQLDTSVNTEHGGDLAEGSTLDVQHYAGVVTMRGWAPLINSSTHGTEI